MKKLNKYLPIIFASTCLLFYSCKSKTICVSNKKQQKSFENKIGLGNSSQTIIISENQKSTVLANRLGIKNQEIKKSLSTKNKIESPFQNKNEEVKKNSKKLSKQEKREIKSAIKQAAGDRTGIGTLLLVIFAILLPPLAVVLVDGLRLPFWLSILLTLLFYVPGLIYALYRVFKAERE